MCFFVVCFAVMRIPVDIIVPLSTSSPRSLLTLSQTASSPLSCFQPSPTIWWVNHSVQVHTHIKNMGIISQRSLLNLSIIPMLVWIFLKNKNKERRYVYILGRSKLQFYSVLRNWLHIMSHRWGHCPGAVSQLVWTETVGVHYWNEHCVWLLKDNTRFQYNLNDRDPSKGAAFLIKPCLLTHLHISCSSA